MNTHDRLILRYKSIFILKLLIMLEIVYDKIVILAIIPVLK